MATIPRRDFLYGLGSSLGALALTDLQAAEKKPAGPLAPKQTMHDPKAKAVIMLFMEGGPSQADTFDPKPIAAIRSCMALVISATELTAES